MGKTSLKYIVFCLIGLASCKSSFEKIRTSGDPQLVLKAANKYYSEKEYFKAQSLYEIVLTSFRGQKEAEEIYFNYAYTHFYLSEFDLAAHLFKTFANTFINSNKKEEADFLSVYSLYKTSPIYRLDQSGTEKAIEGFQLFINSYPNSSRIAECNLLIDECRAKLELKAFEAGKLYFDMKNYQACLASFQNLLNDFPESKRAREIRYFMSKSSYLLAERSVFEKQKERFLNAKQTTEDFIRRYPSGKYTNEIKDLQRKINSKLKSTEYDRYQNTSARN